MVRAEIVIDSDGEDEINEAPINDTLWTSVKSLVVFYFAVSDLIDNP